MLRSRNGEDILGEKTIGKWNTITYSGVAVTVQVKDITTMQLKTGLSIMTPHTILKYF